MADSEDATSRATNAPEESFEEGDLVRKLRQQIVEDLQKGERPRVAEALAVLERIADDRRRQATSAFREQVLRRSSQLIAVAVLIVGLAVIVPALLSRPALAPSPVGYSDAVSPLIDQIDRLTQALVARGPAVAQSSWPVWAVVVISVAVIGAIAAALWGIFRSKDADGLGKAIGAAIVAVGGLFATAKFAGEPSLTADWGDVAVGGLLAILACVAIAAGARFTLPSTARTDGGTQPTAVVEPVGAQQSRARAGYVTLGIAAMCVFGLLLIAYGRYVSHRPAPSPSEADPPSQQKTRTAQPPPQIPAEPPGNQPAAHSVAMAPAGTVGPFPPAVAGLTEPQCTRITDEQRQTLEQSLQGAVEQVTAARRDNNPDLLLVVASFDRSALKRNCLKVYGSNTELARRRAQWVVDRLAAKGIPTDATRVIVSGPTTLTGDSSVDRVVAVYRFITTQVR